VLEKIYLCAEKYAGMRALLTRKTRESMTETVLFTWEQKVVPEGHPMLDGAQRSHRQKYVFPNGSEIVCAGLDKPGKVMSAEYDMVCIFEGIECFEDDLEKLTTRLRNHIIPYQQIIVDVNPDAEYHWLNQRANKGSMARLLSRHEDNPTLFRDGQWTPEGAEYIATLDNLTGVRKERLRFGRWAAAEGLVYDGYDPKIHLIDRFEIPKEWTRIRVIDFGYTNPFVCQWWAVDDDGRAYRYKELYRTETLVEDHAHQINLHSLGERYEANICDHDAEDRATLERHGIRPTRPAHKAITEGIQMVQERLKVRPDGKPRIYLLRDSLVSVDTALQAKKLPTCTEQEINSYVWPKSREGQAVKEEPVKLNDHGMDGMRYLCAYLDKRVLAAGGVVQPSKDWY
jgi:phage terminase large subunit